MRHTTPPNKFRPATYCMSTQQLLSRDIREILKMRTTFFFMPHSFVCHQPPSYESQIVHMASFSTPQNECRHTPQTPLQPSLLYRCYTDFPSTQTLDQILHLCTLQTRTLSIQTPDQTPHYYRPQTRPSSIQTTDPFFSVYILPQILLRYCSNTVQTPYTLHTSLSDPRHRSFKRIRNPQTWGFSWW